MNGTPVYIGAYSNRRIDINAELIVEMGLAEVIGVLFGSLPLPQYVNISKQILS